MEIPLNKELWYRGQELQEYVKDLRWAFSEPSPSCLSWARLVPALSSDCYYHFAQKETVRLITSTNEYVSDTVCSAFRPRMWSHFILWLFWEVSTNITRSYVCGYQGTESSVRGLTAQLAGSSISALPSPLRCPSSAWPKEGDGLKKKEVLPFVTAWMDLDSISLNELSHTEKDKHHMISLICGI